ncbi:uncharacterized protein PRCAT00001608001 [Priceomyces carsonii]|uniref:uncharacterized protein n=1 Tax=Priceomyces carsonii TaxID=28549 RepID=UPI002ED8F818|nr:unnamed protein product [Priceomyces carsonii]
MVSNIWIATADNQIKIVTDYLESGNFTPNSKDPNGYTPIHAAASYGHLKLLKLLVERGGDINIQDNEGDTPLHHVEDVETAKYMIENLNASFKMKNNDGLTAIRYIEQEEEFPELVDYLRLLDHTLTPTKEQIEWTSPIPSLPFSGSHGDYNIRYSVENEEQETDDLMTREERQQKLQEVINSEDPEEALRDLVKNAIHEGLQNYEERSEETQSMPSFKKRKD